MAFRPCECECVFSSLNIGWTLCCKIGNEMADPLCAFGCDPEDATIFRRIFRNAYTEIAFVFVSSVRPVMTSARLMKAEVKEQTEPRLDCQRTRPCVCGAKEKILPVRACSTCHAVSCASAGSRKGDWDTWSWRRGGSCNGAHLRSERGVSF